MEVVGMLYGGCMEVVWRLYGGCMEVVWKLYGGLCGGRVGSFYFQ